MTRFSQTLGVPGVLARVFFGLGILLSSGYAAAITVPVTSTFDTDADGWTLKAGHVGTYQYVSSGGNPGGYVQYTDTGSTAGHIVAPAKFLGDWSNLDGVGTLSWDHTVVQQGTGTTSVPLRAFLIGSGGLDAAYIDGGSPTIGSWTTATADIVEADWTVTSGTWAGLLANVTSLELRIEVFSGGVNPPPEIEGIDNVILTAIPLPATAWFFGSALGLIGWIRRKAA